MSLPAVKKSLEQPAPHGLAALRPYEICSRCVMDTSDPEIQFDAEGVCNHCRSFSERVSTRVAKGAEGEAQLAQLVERIKRDGKGKEYDCIVGVSGGVDSTYVAYKTKKLGLRPLAVHFDNGWNSELAVHNIEKVLNSLGIDLFTYVVDWAEFKDLQLSFLKASTPDSEIPTDHAIFGVLLNVALQHGIKYVISGTNFNTEGVYIEQWGYGHNDWSYIRELHRQFGSIPLKTFPHYGLMKLAWAIGVRRTRFISLLNYLDYDKAEAMAVLEKELGWRAYGGKHHESIYTRFFQSYILPRKFGIDKRRSHLSALIFSSAGAYTREKALKELEQPICSPQLLEDDKQFVIKKLAVSEEEFARILNLPIRSFRDFRSNYQLVKLFRRIQYFLRQTRLIYR